MFYTIIILSKRVPIHRQPTLFISIHFRSAPERHNLSYSPAFTHSACKIEKLLSIYIQTLRTKNPNRTTDPRQKKCWRNSTAARSTTYVSIFQTLRYVFGASAVSVCWLPLSQMPNAASLSNRLNEKFSDVCKQVERIICVAR